MTDANIDAEAAKHVGQYEAVFVFCTHCGHETLPVGWDGLPQARRDMAKHWISNHSEWVGHD